MTTYRQPVPLLWWAKRGSYLRYMLRELSCEFVAWSVIYLGLLVWTLATGRYDWFQDFSTHPLVIVLNLMTLAFLLLHTVTWFGLAPRAMVVHLRGRRVPAGAVLVGHYVAWLVVSAVVAWVVLA
ncbi:fumarate reductase subunit C [Mycolicibacterium sp. HK-90]|uniref:fumarate reductase subunit C n=1 Tax=Mycolicibacterium sp. HK-90 TaxID=3056937 RepID=UPI002659BCC2|nr:fumarate reductase subunit C [Mycolicibacterium sp. HK-90]WKG02533.1 fumarate reductase subunit C [Mycolicibacterium sp. HK-90]